MADPTGATRRIDLRLHKPRLALFAGVRPTLVVAGRGQPVQWGAGTWQVPAGESVVVGVYLYTRLWYFGRAEVTVRPEHTGVLVYRAPVLPFGRGRLVIASSDQRELPEEM